MSAGVITLIRLAWAMLTPQCDASYFGVRVALAEF
jgi:hypothetical protein